MQADLLALTDKRGLRSNLGKHKKYANEKKRKDAAWRLGAMSGLNPKHWTTQFFILALLLQMCLPIFMCAADTDMRFHIFMDLHCEACVEMTKPFLNRYGDKVTVHDMMEENNMKIFNKIVKLIEFSSYPSLMVVVFKGGKLSAVVFGFHSEEEWQKMMSTQHQGVPVYYNRYSAVGIVPNKVLTDQNVIDSIANLFPESGTNELDGYGDIYSLLPLIVVAALVDAVNPCEFYVLVVFLSLVFFHIGRKVVLKAGLAYTAAIFIVYFLMGLGLLELLRHAHPVKVFIVAAFGIFGFFIGLREILGVVLNKEFKHVPEILSKKLSTILRSVSQNPLSAFAIGITAGIFLLPCTSGPYFIAVSLIVDLGRWLDGLILLMVYNGIVAAPFVVITISVYALGLKTGELKRWSVRKQRCLNLVSGLAITFLGLYLLFTIIP